MWRSATSCCQTTARLLKPKFWRKLLDIVGSELRKISEKNRSAYVLVKEEGLSTKEAAAVLGTTAAAVKQRAHRACEHLRAALTPPGGRNMETTRYRGSPRGGAAGVPDALYARVRADIEATPAATMRTGLRIITALAAVPALTAAVVLIASEIVYQRPAVGLEVGRNRSLRSCWRYPCSLDSRSSPR